MKGRIGAIIKFIIPSHIHRTKTEGPRIYIIPHTFPYKTELPVVGVFFDTCDPDMVRML